MSASGKRSSEIEEGIDRAACATARSADVALRREREPIPASSAVQPIRTMRSRLGGEPRLRGFRSRQVLDGCDDPRRGIEAVEDVLHVLLYCPDADPELVGDLVVGVSAADESQNFELAVGKAVDLGVGGSLAC